MTMTLEKVRDWHRNCARNSRDSEMAAQHPDFCDREAKKHDSMADAIDSHLSQPQPVAQGEAVAWTKKAAEFIEKKAQAFADDFGHDDMGSISFGAGRGADQMEEYWMGLIDLAEDFRKLGRKCQVPPDGWECSRSIGHEGPCAALPTATPTIPAGHRLVPVEPTEAMKLAALKEVNPLGELIDWDASKGDCATFQDVTDVYKAMLAAAPDAGGV